MKKRVWIVVMVILMAGPAFAQETFGDHSHAAMTKLGRGFLNIVTSPAEIPCTISSDVKDQGAVGAATGLGKGLVFMLRRILIGATEIGTFFIPAERTIHSVCQSDYIV